MGDDDGTRQAADVHERRVRVALCLANGIALNEVAFGFLGAGLRVPAPGPEHVATMVLLSAGAVVAIAVRPDQHRTIGRVMTRGLLGVLVVVLHALAGAMGMVVAVFLAMWSGAWMPRPGLVVGLLALGSILALVCWMRLRFLRPFAWMLPALVAGTRIWYVPPHVLARLDDGSFHFVVEAGLQSLPSDGVLRVCSTRTVVPGVLEWWHRLDTLPGRSHFVALRLDGADLVVETVSDGPLEPGVEHRIRVR